MGADLSGSAYVVLILPQSSCLGWQGGCHHCRSCGITKLCSALEAVVLGRIQVLFVRHASTVIEIALASSGGCTTYGMALLLLKDNVG